MKSKKLEPKNVDFEEIELVDLVFYCFLFGGIVGHWTVGSGREVLFKLAAKEDVSRDTLLFLAWSMFFVLLSLVGITSTTWRIILYVRNLKQANISLRREIREIRVGRNGIYTANGSVNPAVHSDCIVILEEVLVKLKSAQDRVT
ncbi:uncharacterized protein LOC110855083 [Folsomia candida]|uniref:uncharacterized protein LOC110855083 n=1 Tax=Folsomia candida TaxID=158441 RepID=UPI000B8F6715|nr:uncharacterized protein LOC110855083 [Folsomia candida]